MKKKMTPKKRKIILAILLVAGFSSIEIPGIFIIGGKIYPFILGLPFLYGYIFCVWIYMCMVLFLGFHSKWGDRPFFTSAAKPD